MSSENPVPPATPAYPENPPLSGLEARVLGCLIEKEFSTPDIYPLTLNALVNAANQRNNRSPLLSVGPAEIEAATDQLRQRRLIALFAGADARVPKFRQTIDGTYPIEPVARALLGELLLRGPQTAAELRKNSERLLPMPPAPEVDLILNELAARPAGPLVRRLARQPGQKEGRWAQLFTGEPVSPASVEAGPAPSTAEPSTVVMTLPPAVEQRFAALESEIAALRAELASLRRALGES